MSTGEQMQQHHLTKHQYKHKNIDEYNWYSPNETVARSLIMIRMDTFRSCQLALNDLLVEANSSIDATNLNVLAKVTNISSSVIGEF